MSEEPAKVITVSEQAATAEAAPAKAGGSPKAKAKGKAKAGGKGKGKLKEGKTKSWEFTGPTGSGGYRLNVKNLSNETTTKEQLIALFEPFGKVSSAEVKTREDGTSRGFGYVILPSDNEGEKAIAEMNGKTVGGKALNVAPAERRPADNDGKGKGKGGPAMDMMAQANAAQAYMGMQMQQAYMAQAYMAQAAQMQYALAAMGGSPFGGMPPYPGAGGMLPFGDAAAFGDGQVYEGALKSVNQKNGYGFIQCDQTKALYNRDVYIDAQLCAGASAGDRMRFTVTINDKGHPKAASAERI